MYMCWCVRVRWGHMILESGMCGVRVHVCVMGVSVTRSLPTPTHTLSHRIRCRCIFGEKPDLKILAHKYCHHQPRKPTQRGQTCSTLPNARVKFPTPLKTHLQNPTCSLFSLPVHQCKEVCIIIILPPPTPPPLKPCPL